MSTALLNQTRFTDTAQTITAQPPKGAFFDYSNAYFLYEPYPVGLITPLIEPVTYQKMLETLPPLELFRYKSDYGSKPSHKYTLSERNNPEHYFDYIQQVPIWREFNHYIRSTDFIAQTLDMLLDHHIDLGLKKELTEQQKKKQKKTLLNWFLPSAKESKLSARWDFAQFPADGGCLYPHTDGPDKLITLVVALVEKNQWNQNYGGGTEVLKPIKPEHQFNHINFYTEFEEMESITTFPYDTNQAVIFIKTYNSWHAVRPMTGKKDNNVYRKTLTINIERVST